MKLAEQLLKVMEAGSKDQDKFMVATENLLDDIKDTLNAMNQGYVRDINKKLVMSAQKKLNPAIDGLVDLLNFYNKRNK
jgi:hypothetical protein